MRQGPGSGFRIRAPRPVPDTAETSMLDARGLETTTASEAAVRSLDDTLAHYLRFSTETGDFLKRTLTDDPEMAIAHCMKGYFFMLFCVPALAGKARKSLDTARRCAAGGGATDRELGHLDALDAWIGGEFEQAAAHFEAVLVGHPRDILALKLAQYLHFYLGDVENMRDSVARVLHAWDETVEGYGYVLGMKAFALEEAGACEEAERAGRAAVERNPADLWAVHAVAHVMETQDRRREGIAWVRESEPRLGACNNFGYHLWWHLALFHLELEEMEPVLRLYDERMRADLSDEYLDICNATSMLWRLEERGVDVGDRWNELAERCEARTSDHQMVFPDVHFLLALAAGGRDAAVERMLESMRAFSEGTATQQAVTRAAGIALGRAIAHWYRGEYAEVVDALAPVRYRLPRIGGSHAQRDLFHQILIAAMLGCGRYEAARSLLSERAARKPGNPWTWRRYAQALAALDDDEGATQARETAARLLNG